MSYLGGDFEAELMAAWMGILAAGNESGALALRMHERIVSDFAYIQAFFVHTGGSLSDMKPRTDTRRYDLS